MIKNKQFKISSLLLVLFLSSCQSTPKVKPKKSSSESSPISELSSSSTSENSSGITSIPVTSASSSIAPTSTSTLSSSGTTGASSLSSTSQTPVPSDYYASVKDSDTGTSLKEKLAGIIANGFTPVEYGNRENQTWGAMRITDRNWELSPDENDTNPYMYLLYLVDNENKPHKHSEVEGAWNKEHIWAKSNGFPNEGSNAYGDLHHLRASDYTNNNRRSNYCFKNLTSGTNIQDCNGNNSGILSGEAYMPQAKDRGDVARALFYMATRYCKTSYGCATALQLKFDESLNKSGGWWGNLETLLTWHEQDPVDNFEINRNNLIFERYQHNRNPFIDHPEYARRIWFK